MKFRTFVITKNKLTASVICVALTAAVCAGLTALPIKDNAKLDTMILKNGIADDTELSFGDKLKNILGINPLNPITAAENGMGVGDVTAYESAPPIAETPVPEEETESGDTAVFPTHEEICAGENLSINNATDYTVDLKALCAENLDFSLSDDGPQVLVVHTHTTECYDGDQMTGETERTTDDTKNVAAVGDMICETLEKYGIKTYHDKTYHDYPTYQGSYTRELTTVTSILEQYPSIKVVLDVHRDAFVYEDGSKLRVIRENAERPTAQVMIVVGTDSMGLYHPNWRENLKLASKLRSAAEIMYPGLTRSIDLRQERFNMHMTSGSLLLEVGANGNTLEEALNAAENIAAALAAVLAK